MFWGRLGRLGLPIGTRGYVVRPPRKIPDPLQSGKHEQISPELTFIHRPPPTAPTPFSFTTAPSSPLLMAHSTTVTTDLPPPLRPIPEPKSRHLTKEQIKEIRQLRWSDPQTNTRAKLAKEYGCSQVFIGMIAPLPKAEFERVQQDKQVAMHKWGETKMTIRELRKARKQFW